MQDQRQKIPIMLMQILRNRILSQRLRRLKLPKMMWKSTMISRHLMSLPNPNPKMTVQVTLNQKATKKVWILMKKRSKTKSHIGLHTVPRKWKLNHLSP